ncbi:MAG: long-chain fatty acid--CoA ligase [Verrucomicrobia bacterium]|nr:long-chain fatty acid--CoA ligase [Verrucomicrobiota bacterium]
MTLYTRWLSIADRFSENQALLDWKSGRSWTFAEMQAELDRRESISKGGIVCPKGWQAELIFETLRAWRDDAALCPVEGESPDLERFEGIPANIVHVKMTSGSTAEPKMILFTEDQLAADVANIVATMGLRPEWPNLGVISMAHSYGFSNLVTPLLLHGVPLVWVGDPMPSLISTVLEHDGGAYTLPAVPAMWRAWLEAGVLNGDAVKLAISAGAPLSLELESRLYKQEGLKVHNFYGSSECGGIAYDRSENPREDAACVGTALENVNLEICGSEGKLVVRSLAVGEAYRSANVNETALGNGEFTTSDLAEIDGGTAQVYLRARSGEDKRSRPESSPWENRRSDPSGGFSN